MRFSFPLATTMLVFLAGAAGAGLVAADADSVGDVVDDPRFGVGASANRHRVEPHGNRPCQPQPAFCDRKHLEPVVAAIRAAPKGLSVSSSCICTYALCPRSQALIYQVQAPTKAPPIAISCLDIVNNPRQHDGRPQDVEPWLARSLLNVCEQAAWEGQAARDNPVMPVERHAPCKCAVWRSVSCSSARR